MSSAPNREQAERLQSILRIAAMFGCDEDNCKCVGWRKKTTTGDPSYSCNSCGHPLTRHGNTLQLSPDALSTLAQHANQIEYAFSQANQASDPAHKRTHIERASRLRL